MTTRPDLPPTALVTGGSRGLGRAFAAELLERGWHVVLDGRDPDRLAAAAADLSGRGTVTAIAGDVSCPAHREELAAAVRDRLDLLVNNASVLGPSPRPGLADYPLDDLYQVYAVNTIAPLALLQLVLPALRHRRGQVVNISSDAAVEAYEGWGGYGSSKAALDHLTAIFAAEHPDLAVYAFDPGDMATDLQRQAFPGEDVSDRATAESVAPALLRLVTEALPSGRYRAADLALAAVSA